MPAVKPSKNLNNAANGSTKNSMVQNYCQDSKEILLSPTLSNITERLMRETIEHHASSVSIGRRIFIYFRSADDIVVNAEEEKESGDIVAILDVTCTWYKIKIGPDKTNNNDMQP